jgi:hypothetical protein
MARKSKGDKRKRYEGLLRGVREHFAHLPYLIVEGVRYTQGELLARIQVLLDDMQRSSGAYSAWVAALATERKHEREARSFLRALDEIVVGAFGPRSPTTKAMGVSRRKTGPKTVAAKVEGARKAASTREARGTSTRRRRR